MEQLNCKKLNDCNIVVESIPKPICFTYCNTSNHNNDGDLIGNLKKNVDDLSKGLDTLTEALSLITTNIKTLTSSVDSVQTTVAGLTAEMKTAKKDISDLKNK